MQNPRVKRAEIQLEDAKKNYQRYKESLQQHGDSGG
jgi:hypothetical protein